jgi:outer membrane receptor protein involved in Fe transport
MRGNLKLMLSCGAAVAALMTGAAPAFADTDASSSVAASSSGIEAIVVTADRRSENVQNVAMTVQAFTGETLSDLNVNSLDDLLKFTPNVTYGNNGPGQGNIFMRGLSNGFAGNQSSATVGNFPNVAIYLDDQSMQFPARNVDIYMVDMNRIEVLEGPQGTLFGGGAEAGALRYITNKPVLDELSGNVEVGGGMTHDGGANYNANGVLNLPVIDNKLAVRVVLYDDHQGGYIDNVPSTFTRNNSDLGNSYWNIKPTAGLCPNGLPAGTAGLCSPPNSGPANNYAIAEKDANPVTYLGARLSALYQVNSDWDVLITESLQSMEADGLSVEFPTGSDFQPLKPLQVTYFTPSYERDKFTNTSWTVNGKVGDIKLVYTGAYMVRRMKEQMDYANYSRASGGMYYQCTGGGTGWPGAPFCYSPVGYWDDTVQNTHITQEVRASTPDDWRVRGIIGAYWESFQVDDIMNFNYKTLPACTPADITAGTFCVGNVETSPGTTANDPGVRGNSTAFGEDTQRGYDQVAFFGSFDYDIIPKVLTVTGGTRWYQYSESEVGSQYGTNNGCADVLVCTDDNININAEHDKKVYTGHKSRGNVTWHVTDDDMVYFTYSEGFRPGGFNRAGGDVAPLDTKSTDFQYDKPRSYTPDSLTNYEIGAKTDWFDNRLQINLSAYDMRWADTQLLFFNPTELGNTTFGVNGPNYIIKGVELQAVAEPIDGLTFQGSGSYNDAEQSNSPCLIDNVPGSTDASGNPEYGKCITEIFQKGVAANVPFQNPFGSIGSTPAFSPKYSANMRVRYDWTINDYNLFAQFGGNYTGSMYNQPATYLSGNGVLIPNTTYLRYLQPAYMTFDVSTGVSLNNWSAQIYGTNIFNSHASTFTSSAQFIKSEVPLRPMVLGVKIGYKF